jgi:hypothetical protein
MPPAPTPPELQQFGLSGAELTAALRVFFRIAHEWQLDSAETAVLLGVGASTAQAWRACVWDQPPTGDTAVRLAYLLDIYLSLQLLFPNHTSANDWVHRRNGAGRLSGSSARELMLSGTVGDLRAVAERLTAATGGDFA